MTKLTGKDFNIGDSVRILVGSGKGSCATVERITLSKNGNDLVHLKAGAVRYAKYPFNLALIKESGTKTPTPTARAFGFEVGGLVKIVVGTHANKIGEIVRFFDNGQVGVEIAADSALIEVRKQAHSLRKHVPTPPPVAPTFVEPIPEPKTEDVFVQKKFWIVWSPPQNAFPGSQKAPKARFDSHDKAKDVAASMAQKNPGQKFYVCEVQDSYRAGVVHKELA